MKQISQLIDILKRKLKSEGITYAKLAHTLQLSEASVKRMFSVKEMSLTRLETICRALNMNLSDLFELLSNQQPKIKQLSMSQEQQLVKDTTLMIIAVSIMNHWQYDDILEHYDLDEFELIQKLAILDAMKLIELMPNNRIKSLLHPDFDWRPKGPIHDYFNQKIKEDFFNSDFNQDNEVLIMRSGMLSQHQFYDLQALLKQTANAFIEACQQERKISVSKKSGTALILAMRPWVPVDFQKRQITQ